MSAVKAEDYDSYDELLTDGEDEEQVPLTQTVGHQPNSLIQGFLKPYRTAQYSARDLSIMVNMGDINLEVEYQRDVVWTEARQEGLIDSMFLNYFIPPVLFSAKVMDDGTQKRQCMDGKQRLTSICKFMTGQIPWRPKAGPGKGKRYWYTFNPKEHKGLELPQREKDMFARKQIQCAEFDDLTEDQEREIFQRVQLGVALSAAEKLQALATPYSNWISVQLNKHVFGSEGIASYYTDWKQDRGQAYQNVCVLVFFIEKYPVQSTSVGSTTLTKWLQRVDPPETSMRRKIDRIFHHYIELLALYQDIAINSITSKLSPIEFSFIGVVIYVLGPYMTLKDIAERIGEMRKYVRAFDSNVRSNNTTIQTLWNWLAQQPRKLVQGAQPVWPQEAPEAGTSRKRARPEDDGDYVGGGIHADDSARRNTRFQER